MKKFQIYAMTIVFAMTGFVSCDKEENVPYDQLPDQSKNMLETYFPDIPVTRVTKQTKDNIPYEVVLSNGTEIEFDTNGNWDDIDGNGRPLPQEILNLLPDGIVQYLSANYAGLSVVKIDKERDMYEIELNDDTELHFASDGKFLRVDETGTGIPDDSYGTGSYESLPQAAKDFLGSCYKGVAIVLVEYEKTDSSPYDVRLEGGNEIEFDADGLWTEIDGHNKALNANVTALLPAGITNYATTNYAGKPMTKIEKGPNTIKIELVGDVDLLFNANGEFIRIDD